MRLWYDSTTQPKRIGVAVKWMDRLAAVDCVRFSPAHANVIAGLFLLPEAKSTGRSSRTASRLVLAVAMLGGSLMTEQGGDAL